MVKHAKRTIYLSPRLMPWRSIDQANLTDNTVSCGCLLAYDSLEEYQREQSDPPLILIVCPFCGLPEEVSEEFQILDDEDEDDDDDDEYDDGYDEDDEDDDGDHWQWSSDCC